MTALDALLLLCLAAFAVRGFFRGLVREAASLLALAAALFGAARLARPLSLALRARHLVPEELALAAGAVLAFAGIFSLVALVGWGVDRLAHALFLGPLVRAAGIALAVAKGALLLGFALIIGRQWTPGLLSDEQLAASRLAPSMIAGAHALVRAGGDWLAEPPLPVAEGAAR